MAQPPGYVDRSYPDHVCLLHKSLYSLKQAPRAWFNRLRGHLLQTRFVDSKYDTSLFIRHQGSTTVFFLVYVDDIIVTGLSTAVVNEVISGLKKDFAVRDIGPLHYFLGVEVTSTATGLQLSQVRYITNLLHQYKLHKMKPCLTPMASSSKLSLMTGTPLTNPTKFRSLAGSLQYLSLTRSDISFAVTKICQFMLSPTDTHWSAAKRILRYLKGMLQFGLLLRSSMDFQLQAYFDANWAATPMIVALMVAIVSFWDPISSIGDQRNSQR